MMRMIWNDANKTNKVRVQRLVLVLAAVIRIKSTFLYIAFPVTRLDSIIITCILHRQSKERDTPQHNVLYLTLLSASLFSEHLAHERQKEVFCNHPSQNNIQDCSISSRIYHHQGSRTYLHITQEV